LRRRPGNLIRRRALGHGLPRGLGVVPGPVPRPGVAPRWSATGIRTAGSAAGGTRPSTWVVQRSVDPADQRVTGTGGAQGVPAGRVGLAPAASVRRTATGSSTTSAGVPSAPAAAGPGAPSAGTTVAGAASTSGSTASGAAAAAAPG